MIKIRKFEYSDISKISEIIKKVFCNPWSDSYLKKITDQYPNGFFVAEKNKEIVGFVMGYEKEKGLGWIKIIAVDPEYQGQGIGSLLMNFIVEKLISFPKIGLRVRTNNEKAIVFYQNLGFRIESTINNYFKNGDNAYIMIK